MCGRGDPIDLNPAPMQIPPKIIRKKIENPL